MKRMFFHSPIFVFIAIGLVQCDKADKNQQESLDVFRRQGYEHRLKGDDFMAKGKEDSAFAHYIAAKEKYVQGKDSLSTAHALLKACEILNVHNDYGELQATAVEALNYIDPAKNPEYLPSIYIHIGISFAMSGDLKSAEENYRLGKKYAAGDFQKASFDNNIAYANILHERYGRAFEVLSEAITQYNLADTLAIKSKILDNYGFSAFKTNQKVEGDPMSQALEIRKRHHDTTGLITSYLNLAEVGWDQNPRASIEKAQIAENLAKRNKSASDRLEVLEFLVKRAEAPLSKKYANEYVSLNDSLQSVNRRAKNAFALIKYNFRKANRSRLEAELETAKEQERRLAWTVVALIAMATGAFFVSHLIRRQKKIKQQTEYDTEVRISHRLHDDLANDVHRTIVFAETNNLADKDNKETLLSRLETIYTGTRSISHDNGELPEHVDFGDYLKNLLTEYNSDDRKVIAQGIQSVKWESMERLKKAGFLRIVKELLTNMRKHSDCTHAFFSFSQSGKKVSISYSDNGKGNDDKAQNRKNGLRIMENRISGMGGTATFDSEPGKGFRANIEINL